MKWFAFIFCILLGSSAFAAKDDRPELKASLISDVLRENAYDVVRESATTLAITSRRDYTLRTVETVTILDTRSSANVLVLPYDKYSKAKITNVFLYDGEGRLIRKVKKDEIRDYSAYDGFSVYSDNRVLAVELHGGQLPYSLTYEYELSFKATMAYPSWRPAEYHTAVETSSYRVEYPPEMHITAFATGIPDSDHGFPSTRSFEGVEYPDHPGRIVQSWQIQRMPAFVREENLPRRKEVLPVVYIAPGEFEVEGYSGEMSDWKSFGKFIYDINQGREKVTPEMAARVRKMVDGVSSDTEKIAILYDYLKSNTRYVSVQLGIGGWQAYNAEYVERNKYGDCKALSYFMKGLLDAAGIQSHAVLIGAGRPSLIREEIVTPGSFNHMMLYVPDEDVWLECTSTYSPPGYIYDVTSDRDVLLVTREGGVVAHTPLTAVDSAATITTDSLRLEEGLWSVKGTQIFTYADQDRIREYTSRLSRAEQESAFREACRQQVRTLSELNYHVDPDKPSASCAFQMTLAHLGTKAGSRLLIPVLPLSGTVPQCRVLKRNQDMASETAVHQENTVVFEIPAEYKVEAIPEQLELNDPRFGSYRLEYIPSGQFLEVRRHLHLIRYEIPAEEYEDLCAFLRQIEMADRGQVSLIRTTP